MLKQIVEDYLIVNPLESNIQLPQGDSASPKWMIFHILESNANQVDVLDIGFGVGSLGRLIKSNRETSHWSVDGIDGWSVNCNNSVLFSELIYRDIWHGLAQELPSEKIKKYKIICLLDVIEHLDGETAKWLLRTLLTNMGEDSYLFISTPLWFYPQDVIQEGDMEEHLIGIPASSMMALIPTLYAINSPLVGGFVLNKSSLKFIEFFHPTADKNFTYDKGLKVLQSVNMQSAPGVVYKTEAYFNA
jgi:2-polyprenyl-3-methyl-5-hydroxy-6-metoxy-1,4-benzoquinol methylase